ncbi:hypothetical protein Hanom_Chr03g00230331 [Helianthus anomalus]
MSTTYDVVMVEETGGGRPVSCSRADRCRCTVGYITLFADLFGEGNLQLPTTHFLGSILQYYGFYISQFRPMGIVRIRHVEFVCRSQGEEPTVDRFKAFYQLQSNLVSFPLLFVLSRRF